MNYEGKARKGTGIPKVAEGMRRVIVGKVGLGNDDVDQIDKYLDEDGHFQGEIVHESGRRRFVDYPQANYDAYMKEVEGEALRRVAPQKTDEEGTTLKHGKSVSLSGLVKASI